MKRRVTQAVLLATFACTVTGILCWPTVLKYLVQSNLQNVRKQGTSMSWSGLSTGMTSAEVEIFTVWIPGPRVKGNFRVPISLELQNVAVALRLTSLLSLNPAINFSTALYGGTLQVEAQSIGEGAHLDAHIENVEIGRHPQIASLGVRGGTISGTLQDIDITPQGPTGGTFSFTLRSLTPPTLDVAKSLLRVEEFGAFDLEANGTFSPEAVEVPKIHLTSMFGEVSGKLTATNHLSPTPKLDGQFDVSLSEKGASTLGAWLPLIPGAGLDSSTTKFAVKAASASCSNIGGSSTVLNLGNGCVKLVFAKN